jgi:hypothetical protein
LPQQQGPTEPSSSKADPTSGSSIDGTGGAYSSSPSSALASALGDQRWMVDLGSRLPFDDSQNHRHHHRPSAS